MAFLRLQSSSPVLTLASQISKDIHHLVEKTILIAIGAKRYEKEKQLVARNLKSE
jgi:hypothetical protein